MFFLTTIAIVAGCASQPPIATVVSYENRPGTKAINNYRVEFDSMPEFLKPMLRDEASIALSAKGLEYTEGDAHGILLMTYVQRPLTAADEERDDIDAGLSSGGESKFIAEVHVDLKDAVTSELIWSGILSRYHNALPGSYMHEAPARIAMRQAFLDLFSDYPDVALEKM
jgi:hypothetical protein